MAGSPDRDRHSLSLARQQDSQSCAVGQKRVYKVKFSTLLGHQRSDLNDLGLSGSGEIGFSGDTVVMHGPEVTDDGLHIEYKYRIDQFADVSVHENSVRFSLKLEDGDLKEAQLWTDDVDTAIRIAAELPRKKSEEQAAAEQYDARLDAIGRIGAVSIALIVANVAIFLWVAGNGGGFLRPNISVLEGWGTLSGPLVRSGQWWRLVTACFLHFGVIHLALNMAALAFVGPIAEREFGSIRFAAIYMLAGVAGALCSVLVHPDVNGAGASGAIFGIYGALLAVSFRRDLGIPALVLKRQKAVAAAFILGSILGAVRFHMRVDFAAHIGGLAAGMLFGTLLATRVAVAAAPGSNP